MTLFLKNGTVVSAGESRQMDILIRNEKIVELGENLAMANEKAVVIDLAGKLVFPGFLDMHVHLREPGQEEKETLATGLAAAVHGGITAVCSMPNTTPVIDNEFLVKFLVDKAWEINKARLYPVGSITKRMEGQELSEMASMIRAGAVAFTDDGKPITDMLVLRRALQYLKAFGKPLLLHCESTALSVEGVMNEGYYSTKLGLPGIHRAAEEASIAESIEVAKYFGPVHIQHVSTRGGVEIIRNAKQRGIAVTCETAPHYFALTEAATENYNTLAKMNPPLRTESDRQAIIAGLRDGTIDAIATDHAPHTVDDKHREFATAAFGITGLESAVMLTIKVLVEQSDFTWNRVAELWTINPHRILGIPGGVIEKGGVADLTIIDPKRDWQYAEEKSYSKSKNTPFLEWSGTGRAVMTLVNGRVVWEDK